MKQSDQPRMYHLFRRERRAADWVDQVTRYEPLYPRELRRMLQEGWKIDGNRHGDEMIQGVKRKKGGER